MKAWYTPRTGVDHVFWGMKTQRRIREIKKLENDDRIELVNSETIRSMVFTTRRRRVRFKVWGSPVQDETAKSALNLVHLDGWRERACRKTDGRVQRAHNTFYLHIRKYPESTIKSLLLSWPLKHLFKKNLRCYASAMLSIETKKHIFTKWSKFVSKKIGTEPVQR